MIDACRPEAPRLRWDEQLKSPCFQVLTPHEVSHRPYVRSSSFGLQVCRLALHFPSRLRWVPNGGARIRVVVGFLPPSRVQPPPMPLALYSSLSLSPCVRPRPRAPWGPRTLAPCTLLPLTSASPRSPRHMTSLPLGASLPSLVAGIPFDRSLLSCGRGDKSRGLGATHEGIGSSESECFTPVA